MEPWGNLQMEVRKIWQENWEEIQENPITVSSRGGSCYGVVKMHKGGVCFSGD